MQDLFSPSQQTEEDTMTLYFDSQWNLCSPGDSAGFSAELIHTPDPGTGIMEAQISIIEISSPDSPIYTLSVMHHAAERRDLHE